MSTQIGPARIDRDKIVQSVALSALIGQDQQIVRDGSEYRTLCPWHRDSAPSLTINDAKGFYHCFACGAHGTAIDWIMFQRGVDFRTACDELASLSSLSITASAKAPKLKRQGREYKAVVPVPDGVPSPNFEIGPANGKPALGIPLRTWTYRDQQGRLLGYVCRYRSDPETGKKEVRTWTYGSYPRSEHTWERTVRWRIARWEGGTYPLYGLWKLSEPGAESKRIFIVSGEKCTDALQSILPDDIVLTWVGGDDGKHKVDWSPVCGLPNNIILWPDADESGREAMDWIAREIGDLMLGSLYLINVDDPTLPKGWDCADAIEDEGKDIKWFHDFIGKGMPDEKPRAREYPRVRIPGALVAPKPVQEPEPPTVDTSRIVMSDGSEWWNQPWGNDKYLMLTKDEKPQMIRCDANAAVPLREDEALKGALRLNMIRGKVEITRALPWGDMPGEWCEENLTGLCQWLNRMRFHFTDTMMGAAVRRVAYENRYNPLADYLEALEWDGVPRLERWLPTYTGCEDNFYTREIGKRWMVGGAARGHRPGTQVDTMLVLESGEGTRKTSLLRALGGSYFTPLRGDIGGSDGRATLQAATNWIIEFDELEALNKASWTALKAFITTTDEMMRLAYRRDGQRLFRSAIFAGTTNESEWLPPDGDHRRFWPVKVVQCDVEGLRRDRDQLWAEAFHLYKQGQRWWFGDEETDLLKMARGERDTRRFHDEWHSEVMLWLHKPLNAYINDFTLTDIARGALGVERDKLDKATQMRLGKIMAAADWKRVKVRNENGPAWVWRRPENETNKELFE